MYEGATYRRTHCLVGTTNLINRTPRSTNGFSNVNLNTSRGQGALTWDGSLFHSVGASFWVFSFVANVTINVKI